VVGVSSDALSEGVKLISKLNKLYKFSLNVEHHSAKSLY